MFFYSSLDCAEFCGVPTFSNRAILRPRPPSPGSRGQKDGNSSAPTLRRVLLHLKRTKAGMRGALTHPEQVQATLQARALQYDGVPIALQTVTWTSQARGGWGRWGDPP